MASIFTKIVNGEIPAHKIAEDDNYLAFLDAFPLAEGHVLVIPKQEVDYIFDMEDELYIGLQLFAKKVAKALGSAIPCTKVGVSVVGLEVPHTHIHLIPINGVEDMNFAKPKLKIEASRMEEIAKQIQAKL
ncbi:MAG: HIT family protein [Cytophagales bacterium]|nr:HIT family protein [Cytophagales bacterium]